MQLAIVERGHFATYELLCRTFASDPSVRVMWDRRVRERRRSDAPRHIVDQRRADRRRLLSSDTWRPHRYVLVNAANGPSPPGD